MVIAYNYIVPDTCPENCKFKGDLQYGQNAICTRCPVLICKEPETKEEEPYLPIIDRKHYRDDWAKEWQEFFNNGTIPELRL